MKTRSPVRWLLVVSIAICAAVSFAIRQWPAARWAGNNDLVALTTEADRLRDATDNAVAAWRQKAAIPARQGWTPDMLEQFQRSFGPPWHCEWQNRESGFRGAVISRSNVQLGAWKEILSQARSLESRPGLAIEKVEITVTGNGPLRRFGRIAFAVRITLENRGSAARPVSLGARPGPRLVEPARSRAGGERRGRFPRGVHPGSQPPGPALRPSRPGLPRAEPVSCLTYLHTSLLLPP